MSTISHASGVPGSGGGSGIGGEEEGGGGGGPVDPEGVREAILALSPVGYWPLDDSSGAIIVDASGNGRDGTLVGSVTLADVTAPDGNDYPTFAGGHITIPDDDVFSANTAAGITMFAIVKPTELTGNGRHHVLAKGQGGAYEWEMGHSNLTAGRIYWATLTAGGAGLTSVEYAAGIGLGWNVLAARTPSPSRGADVDVYHNSPTEKAVNNLTNFAGTYVNGAAPVVIGARNDFPAGQSFLGQMAHVALFAGEVDLSTVFAEAESEGWY